MQKFKIKVKDVKEFVKTANMRYASGDGKRFNVALHAGPNVCRYCVEIQDEPPVMFKNAGKAVKYFNEN